LKSSNSGKSRCKKSLDSVVPTLFFPPLCLLEEFDKYLKWKMMNTNQQQQREKKKTDTIKQKMYTFVQGTSVNLTDSFFSGSIAT
jgi:hypothetical protein